MRSRSPAVVMLLAAAEVDCSVSEFREASINDQFRSKHIAGCVVSEEENRSGGYSTSATDQRDSLSGLLVMYTARIPLSMRSDIWPPGAQLRRVGPRSQGNAGLS